MFSLGVEHVGGGEVCAGCESPIADRFLLRVNDRSWHETCVKCAVCLTTLTGTCYSRDRLLYCKHDYEKVRSAGDGWAAWKDGPALPCSLLSLLWKVSDGIKGNRHSPLQPTSGGGVEREKGVRGEQDGQMD
ncbi:hypothetical protein ACEWY4_003346 [Coilia grayii]|uniref:LIM zinc-binding domain-containing protein n=1 Tax=Coilia grayii TaxID=363190 RepID=A0ABD1KR03_9TELE